MSDIFQWIRRYGIFGVYRKAKETMATKTEYDWNSYAPGVEELEQQSLHKFGYMPKISIVVPCYRTPIKYLIDMVRSVKTQSYENWELILVDASEEPLTKLDELHNPNIIVKHLETNQGISENTNEGLQMASGEYIGLLDHDDILSPNALYEMVAEINRVNEEERDSLFLYSDEDKVSADGEVYYYPHFKTDYNKELIRHYNYFCHFTVFSKKLLDKTGKLDPNKNGAQDYDLFLRMLSEDAIVRHVPKILYHWRVTEGSTAGSGINKNYAYVAGVKSIEDYLKRENVPGMVSISEDIGQYYVTYDDYQGMAQGIDDLSAESLDQAAASVVVYRNPSVSEVRFHHQNGQSLKQKKSLSLKKSKTRSWQQVLASYLTEPDVAIAFSRSSDGKKILHCGIFEKQIEDGVVIGNAFEGLPVTYKGYMKRASLAQDVEGFREDCVFAGKRKVLYEAGGLRKDLPSPQAEMELCRRLREMGYRIVVVPHVESVIDKRVK